MNGNYTVSATTISPLLGPRVETNSPRGWCYTDLGITVTDGKPAVNGRRGHVHRHGHQHRPRGSRGATVTDTFPAELTGVSWTCAAAGSVCLAVGSGNINQPVTCRRGHCDVHGDRDGHRRFRQLLDDQCRGRRRTGGDHRLRLPQQLGRGHRRHRPALPLQVNKNATDSGLGTVTSSPASISCGTGCASATANFVSGTIVVLTAVARPGDTFVGWEGDCTGSASTCSVTMSVARTVTARFKGLTITTTAGTGGTVVCSPASVAQGGSSVCTITPTADYALSTLTDNAANVLGSVSGSTYTLTNVTVDHTVAATFNHRPDITGSPGTNAAAGTPYSYVPSVNDPDGPGPLAGPRRRATPAAGPSTRPRAPTRSPPARPRAAWWA